jgi:hypothetical protein
MSIILDALKKLDRERSCPPDGPPDIDIEILRSDPPPRGKRVPLYFATVFLTAIAAIAITYAVVVWFGLPSKSRPPASVNSSAPKQQAKPASPEASSPSKPRSPASVISLSPKQQVKAASPEANSTPKSGPPTSVSSSAPSQQVIPAPPSHEPTRASGEETGQEPSKIQNPPEKKDPVTSLAEKKEGQNVIPEEAGIVLGNKGKGVGPTPSGSATVPPSLRITVIGWDEDPSKRFAFINGMMVHEGDIIEEAKVVEINPKRVRFLQNGQYFEIPM